MIGFQFLFILLFIIPAIFFFITQQNTLKSIQLITRAMKPGEVWLQLILVFGLIWQFIVVNRIADSIRRELNTPVFSFDQNSDLPLDVSSPRPTHSIGVTYCVLICCSVIPIIGVLFAFAGFICWIIYWVQLVSYKTKVQQKNYSLASPPAIP